MSDGDKRILWAVGLTVLLRVARAHGQAPGELPDQALSPGEVRAGTLEEFCAAGSATDARHVTRATKREVRRRYGLGFEPRGLPIVSLIPMVRHTYEIDHIIPLCLGGANTVANLFPQSWQGTWTAAEKDRLEKRLCAYVCSGRVPLEEAQRAMASNWIEAYHTYVEGPPPPKIAPKVVRFGEGQRVGPPGLERGTVFESDIKSTPARDAKPVPACVLDGRLVPCPTPRPKRKAAPKGVNP